MSLPVVLFAVATATQQPAPQPAPPTSEAALQFPTPEEQADADLRSLGTEATRKGAIEALKQDLAADAKIRYRAPVGIKDCLDYELYLSLRYYLRAQGLPDVERTREMVREIDEMGKGEFGTGTDAARDEGRRRVLGDGYALVIQVLSLVTGPPRVPDYCPEPLVLPPPQVFRLKVGGKTIIVGGAVVVGGLAVIAGGGGDDPPANTAPPPPPPAPVDVSALFGTYGGQCAVVGTTINGCSGPISVPASLTLNGNRDGTGLTMNMGGTIFQGTARADGSFDVEYNGTANGFPGLQPNASIQWRLSGTIRGGVFNSAGDLTVRSGNCNGAVVRTTVVANRAN